MLKFAKLESPFESLDVRPEPRGSLHRRLNADDLIAFGRCPARWHRLDEGDAPRLVCRRRASPELLDEGRKRLGELMASYAQCLKRNQWPAFEPDNDTTKNAWTPVALQPWMTSGAGPHGGYFAPTALANTVN